MQKRQVLIRSNLSQEQVEALIEPWAGRQGAKVRPMGRLTRQYTTEGENMHWHIGGKKRGMGTVEVTYIPSTGNLTVLVHDNRKGVWTGKMHESLAKDIPKRARRLSS